MPRHGTNILRKKMGGIVRRLPRLKTKSGFNEKSRGGDNAGRVAFLKIAHPIFVGIKSLMKKRKKSSSHAGSGKDRIHDDVQKPRVIEGPAEDIPQLKSTAVGCPPQPTEDLIKGVVARRGKAQGLCQQGSASESAANAFPHERVSHGGGVAHADHSVIGPQTVGKGEWANAAPRGQGRRSFHSAL